ncbi:IclR family transcriptional regulator [Streptomyces sp. NPDC057654]|uniref:IclR family transcriptional regulator n=1 Tax=Streptomyces sp. NPDC057654 TaxID=3346196 RepID=UPI0036850F2B
MSFSSTGRLSELERPAMRTTAGGRGVLEGAFSLLEAVERAGEAGLTRLANDSGLPKATAHRLLSQLVELGAVERVRDRYRMGSRIFRLGRRWQPHPALLGAARAPVRHLADTTGATVGLCVLREGRTMVVAGIGGRADELAPQRPGAMYPWSTAAGKVLVAGTRPGLPPGPLPSSWARTAAAIRDKGIAFDHEEIMPGVFCAAVPLFGADDVVVASVCAVTGSAGQLARLAEPLTQAGQTVSTALRNR